MHKTWLIIQREYVTRVRSRTFILSTILTPLFFTGLIVATVFFAAREQKAGLPGKIIGNDQPSFAPGTEAAYAIGYAASFLIYITIMIYGTMVMRGVSEEKTNRIAEIIISSVKPFQLMMGKIIGIGAVGITQFGIWIVLMTLFFSSAYFFLPADLLPQSGSPEAQQQVVQLGSVFAGVNIPLVIFCFIFYFICGYLFYASIFAAIGSAVNEDAQDTQSLMLPVTMPIILAIVIMLNSITQPSGSLATWSSMIPFFSPVVMMARIPFGVPSVVPYWQLGLSMLLMVAGFLFTTWLSAKIYRTGILLYGKKITWKEMWKWTLK